MRAALACAARRLRWWQVEAALVAGRATRAPSALATTNGAAKEEHRDCSRGEKSTAGVEADSAYELERE